MDTLSAYMESKINWNVSLTGMFVYRDYLYVKFTYEWEVYNTLLFLDNAVRRINNKFEAIK